MTLADNTLIHSFIQCRFQVNSSEMQNDVDILYYIAAYYNPNNLLPTQSVQVCPQQPPPSFPCQPQHGQYLRSGRAPTQSEGTGGVQGGGRLTAVPERMLRDDGWPSRYVMS